MVRVGEPRHPLGGPALLQRGRCRRRTARAARTGHEAPNLIPVVLDGRGRSAAGGARLRHGPSDPGRDSRSATTSTSWTWRRASRALEAIDARDESLTVNVGTGVGVSVLEVLEAARRITGRESRPMAAPRREGDPSAIWADTRAGGSRAARLARDPHARRHRRLGVALAHRPIPRAIASPADEPARHGPIGRDGRPRDRRLTVAYVMSRFPKLTETFILAEIVAMDRAGVRVELHPLLRQRGEPVQPAAVRWVERAHYLPFLSPAIRAASCAFLRDPRRRRRYLRGTRGHDPRHVAQPELPVRRAGHLPEGRPRRLAMEAEGVEHVHCHFANHPALAGLPRPPAGRDPVQLHGARLRPPRRPDDAAGEGRRGRVRRDDLAGQPARSSRRPPGPAPSGKVEVIHCGVDPAAFRPTATGRDGPLRIVAVGTLHEVKGQVHLIEACRSAGRAGACAFTCRFIGDGPDRAALDRADRAPRVWPTRSPWPGA